MRNGNGLEEGWVDDKIVQDEFWGLPFFFFFVHVTRLNSGCVCIHFWMYYLEACRVVLLPPGAYEGSY
jgi:hypothetical protein